MKKIAVCLALLGCVASAAEVELKTEEQKTFYALGLYMGRNLTALSVTPAELKLVEMGMRDSALGKTPQVDLAVYGPKINEIAQKRQGKQSQARKDKEKAFLEKTAKEPNAKKLPNGAIYVEVKQGTGASPKAEDTVKCHYQGTLVDGTEFDSSIKRGQPADFPLKGVIPCWTEGIQKMKVGGKAKLICPSDIAYGDEGRPPTIPGGATLIFEVELLDVVKK
jgi:FKBP-type peptidyl-prolyl cis-trans isomerase FkpA